MGLKTLWKAVMLVALFSITVVFTFYTVSAHHVASHIGELEGHLVWSSRPGGSFFPWPMYPGGIVAPMTFPVNEVDALYYELFIKSWILVGIAILLWAVTVVFLLFKFKKKSIMKDICIKQISRLIKKTDYSLLWN